MCVCVCVCVCGTHFAWRLRVRSVERPRALNSTPHDSAREERREKGEGDGDGDGWKRESDRYPWYPCANKTHVTLNDYYEYLVQVQVLFCQCCSLDKDSFYAYAWLGPDLISSLLSSIFLTLGNLHFTTLYFETSKGAYSVPKSKILDTILEWDNLRKIWKLNFFSLTKHI